jgi:hypothetical protein
MSAPITAPTHRFHWRPARGVEPTALELRQRFGSAPEPAAQRRLRLLKSSDVPASHAGLPPPAQNARPRLNSTRG